MIDRPSARAEKKTRQTMSHVPSGMMQKVRIAMLAALMIPSASVAVQGQEKVDPENGRALLFLDEITQTSSDSPFGPERIFGIRETHEKLVNKMATLVYETEPLPDTKCLRVTIDDKGYVLVHSLQKYWDEYCSNKEKIKSNALQTTKNSTTSNTILENGSGSGFCVKANNGDEYVASNWHVYGNANDDATEKMAKHFPADIAVIPKRETFTWGGSDTLPTVFLPHESVNNKTLPSLDIRFHGLGVNCLCTAEGKPISIMMKYGTLEDHTEIEMFALLVPEDQVKHRYQFQGTSGSPVTIRNTGEVIGISHHARIVDGVMYLIFSGPDDIRKAFVIAETQFATHESISNTMALDFSSSYSALPTQNFHSTFSVPATGRSMLR